MIDDFLKKYAPADAEMEKLADDVWTPGAVTKDDDLILMANGYMDRRSIYSYKMRKEAVRLEVKELGFGSITEINSKYNADVNVSIFEVHRLIQKHLPTIIKNLRNK